MVRDSVAQAAPPLSLWQRLLQYFVWLFRRLFGGGHPREHDDGVSADPTPPGQPWNDPPPRP
jgi:hypothetical protein